MKEELNVHTLQTEYEQTAGRLAILNELNEKCVMVTGATGFIGSQLVKTILCYNRLFNKKIHIIACGRSNNKLTKIYGHLSNLECLHLIKSDVSVPVEISYPIHYIIHCASITSSKDFIQTPVDTIKTLLAGTQNMLELAKNKDIAVFLYLSSLEVYGVPYKFEVSESDYGLIDFLSVRSSYSEGKRMAECLCEAYLSQYNVPIKIARLAQTIGSGIDYSDSRVFAQFAKSVIEKKDIVLNTPGRTVRNYCDICDAVTAIFTILIKGAKGEAYNVANPNTAISIADLAQFICNENASSGIKVLMNNSANAAVLGYNPEMKISLETKKIQSLGWNPEYSLKETFYKLIAGLNEKRALEGIL